MMQTLGYYDGKYDEIDKMVVPLMTVLITMVTVYMMPPVQATM